MKKIYITIFSLVISSFSLHAQLGLGTPPADIIGEVFATGNCVGVNTINQSGPIGTFTNGGSIGLGGNNGEGILLACGPLSNALGPNTSTGTSGGAGGAYAALATLTNGFPITEGAFITFEFTPVEDFVSFNFIFASEEYGGDFDCSQFNDAFGFFLSGPDPAGGGDFADFNLATLNGIPITINNFNDQGCGDPTNYAQNGPGGTLFEYDGYYTGSINQEVIPCETYTITIAVADAGDAIYDSAVFLEGNSFSTGNAATVSAVTTDGEDLTDAYEGCQTGQLVFCRDENSDINDNEIIQLGISGTATAGADYSAIPDEITIPAGFDCINVNFEAFDDGVVEGVEFLQIDILNSICPCGDPPLPVIINIFENDLQVSTNNPELCNGQPAVLTAFVAGGIPPYTYQWFNATDDAIVSTSSTFVTPPVFTGVPQSYYATITDACGNAQTTATLNLQTVNEIELVIDEVPIQCPPLDANGNLLDSQEMILFANFQFGQWEGVGIVDDRDGIFDLVVAYQEDPIGPYVISYTTENNCGLSQTASILIEIEPQPFVFINDPGPICSDVESLNLTATVQLSGFNQPEPGGTFFWSGIGIIDPFTGEFWPNQLDETGTTTIMVEYTSEFGCYVIPSELEITLEPSPTATIIGDVILCNGGATPPDCPQLEIEIPDIGTPPYTVFYSINGVEQASIPNLQAGTINIDACEEGEYEITRIESFYCEGTGDGLGTATELPELTATFPESTVCYSPDVTHLVEVQITGEPPFTLNYSGPAPSGSGTFSYSEFGFSETTLVLELTQPGDYFLEALTSITLDCPATISSNVFTIADFELSDGTVSNGTCGDANGSVTAVNITGDGLSNVEYNWVDNTDGSTVATTPDLTGVTDGDFSLIVTNDFGCLETISYIVENELSPVLSGGTVTPETCELSNGSVTGIMVTGGTGTISYEWSNTIGVVASSPDLLNAEGGDYTLVITDQNDCTDMLSFTIDAFENPEITGTDIQTSSCGQSDGSITNVQITTATGVNIATYSWTNSNGDNVGAGDVLNNIVTDTYTLTVTDDNGCTDTFEVFVDEVPGPTLSGGTSQTETCSLNDGGVTGIIITNGTEPFNFNWTDSGGNSVGSSLDLSGVAQGDYSLQITDFNGCTDQIGPFTVDKTPDPTLSNGTVTNGSCGEPNGSINGVTASGGTGNYFYSWTNASNSQVGTSLDLDDVGEGTYTLTITDEANCTATISFPIIDQPGPILSGGETTLATCEQDNGTVTNVQISGGTGNISYSWVNSLGVEVGNSIDLNNAAADTYTLTATDENSCTDELSFTIQNAQLPEITGGVVANSTCSESNGSITGINVSGLGDLQIVWTNSVGGVVGTSENITDQPADDYTITLTDANGCETSTNFTIEDEPSPTLGGATSNPSSCGQADGSIIDVEVNEGGNSNISYQWTDSNGGNVGSNADLTNVVAGSYTLTIIDGNGCTDNSTYNIIDVGAPIIDQSNENVTNTTCSGTNGSIVGITASGGTGALSFSWALNNVEVGTNLDISSVEAGDYVLTVTDESGCSASVTVIVPDEPGPILSGGIANNSSFCEDTGSVTGINVTSGTDPITYQWFDQNNTPVANQTSLDITNIPAGDYTITATDANNCTFDLPFTVNIDGEPILTGGNVQNTTCSQNNGSVTNINSNGVNPLTYAWTNDADNSLVSTSLDLLNQSAGDYTITMTDGNNCTISLPFSIQDEPSPELSGGTPNQSSCQQSDGSVTGVIPNGGTGNLTYNWTNSTGNSVGNTIDLLNVFSGAYTLTVTDENGCTDVASFDVLDAAAPQITGGVISNTTCSQDNGAVTGVSASGGTGALIYSWTNSNGVEVSTSLLLNNVLADTYVLTVTDESGCTATATFNIPDEPSPTLTGGTVQPATCGQDNGSVTQIIPSGGTGTLNYVWTDINGAVVGNGIDLFNQGPGEYTVTVTDANNCTNELTFSLTDLSTPQITIDDITVSECGIGTGTISISVSSGVGNFTYEWTDEDNNVVSTIQDPTGLLPGNYTVAVTDEANCTVTEVALVPGNIPPPILNCGESTIETLTFEWTAVPGATGYDIQYDGITLSLDANTLSFTVENLSPQQTITFEVATVGEDGCGTSAFVNIDCTTLGCPDVDVTLDGLGETYCVSDSPVTLVTTPDGTIISGPGISGNIFNPSVAGAGTHLIEATYEIVYPLSTCPYSTDRTVTVLPDPVADFDVSSESTCVGEALQFNFTGSINTGDEIQWDFGENSTPSTAAGNGPHSVSWGVAGVKEVTVSILSDNCNDEMSMDVPVSSVEVSTIGDQIVDAGSIIELSTNANSALNGDLTFSWTDSNAEAAGAYCDNCEDPTVAPTNATTFSVTVEDEYGCVANTLVNLEINPAVTIPTAFSPDGDGVNDNFRVITFGNVNALDFYIYDRWGEILYETHEINHTGWDGTFNGTDAELGVYVWYCTYIDPIGRDFILKGNVTLIR